MSLKLELGKQRKERKMKKKERKIKRKSSLYISSFIHIQNSYFIYANNIHEIGIFGCIQMKGKSKISNYNGNKIENYGKTKQQQKTAPKVFSFGVSKPN